MRRPALILLLALGIFVRADTPPPEKTEEPEPPEKVSLTLDAGGHTDTILTVAFTPDEKELMTASRDGTVRFWDIDTGETTQVLRPPITVVNTAALSPDGRTVAVGGKAGKDGIVLLLNRSDDRVRTLPEHDNHVETLAFSPDGKWLAVAGRRRLPGAKKLAPGNDNNLRLWNVGRGETAVVWKDDAAAAHAVAFSPDGKWLATVSDGGECAIWSPGSKERVGTIMGHRDRVWGVAWTPDGKQIATSGDDGLRLWNIKDKTSTLLSRQYCHDTRVCFSGDGKKLLYWAAPFEELQREGRRAPSNWPAAFERLRVAMVRDLVSGQETVFPGHMSDLSAGALSKDGQWAATAGGTGHEIFLWKTAMPLKDYRRLGGRGVLKYGVGLSADGKTIAWGNRDISPIDNFQATVPLEWSFSFESLKLEKLSEDARRGDSQRAELRRDGLAVELHGDRKGIDVKRDGKTLVTHPFPRSVFCAALLPGNRVVVGTAAALWVLSAEDRPGERLCRLHGHQGGVLAVAASPDGRYLLSAGLDTTLRLWDLGPLKADNPPKELRPTLSFFTGGPEYWIAWTPEGYHAASPNGEQIMGWLKDNGQDRLRSFYSADQFRKSLYKPDVIKVLLAQGSLEKALRWKGDREDKPLQGTEILPPAVAITAPNDGEILDEPDLTVRAIAERSGTEDVTGFQLLVDGRPFPAPAPELKRDPKTGNVEAKWRVKAPPGRHRFSALAQTKTAEGRSSAVVVNNTAPPPPPRLFFLGIGINDYQNITPLAGAVNDATALEKEFLAQHKASPLFGDVKTVVLPNEKATPKAILAGLDWLAKAEPDDVVVIFYAGHGERDDRGEFQLLTAAFDPKKVKETAVGGTELKSKLTALQSRRVLMLLDACHSGAIATDALAGDLKQPDCGVAVLCAAQGHETSQESARDRHGYFTKWLLDGLRGGAGTNEAGQITLARLYMHVEEKVPGETEDRQHPVLVGLTAIRSFPLGKVLKAAKP